MPMLELTDDQVVELVKQLPPEQQRNACWRSLQAPRSLAGTTCKAGQKATAAPLYGTGARLGQDDGGRAGGVRQWPGA